MIPFLERLLPRRGSGGTVSPPSAPLDDDRVPALLSPGRSTWRRPGESWAEATDRLVTGEDCVTWIEGNLLTSDGRPLQLTERQRHMLSELFATPATRPGRRGRRARRWIRWRTGGR